MEKVLVDTSGWVALFMENDKNHKKAVMMSDNNNSPLATIIIPQ